MTVRPSGRLAAAQREIEEMIGRGQFAEAEALARRMVAANLLSASAHYTLGIALQVSGRFELAEPSLARAVTLDDRNIDHLLNYGLCLLSMGRVAEAEPLYRRAHSLEPRNVVTTWRMGSFRARIGHMEQALAHYEAALGRATDVVRHHIRLDIAECLLSLGRVDEAREFMLRELDRSPHRARYLCLISAAGREDAGSSLYTDICREIARPGLALGERSNLMIRKGVMLQASGRHDEAFATFREAKMLLRAAPVTAAFHREVDMRIAAVTPERLQALAWQAGAESFRPIFVVGLPRSGTTLAAQILSAHSMAGNAGELETLTYVASRLGNAGHDGGGALATLYEGAMRVVVPDKPRPVDKMPLNFRFVAEAAALFPGACFVHCTRHPADTFISALQTEMNEAHSYSYDPASFAAYYGDYRRLMAHWDQLLPGRVFSLSYEALVSDPGPTIRALLAAVDLPFEPACLAPERNSGAVSTFSRLQVRSGITAASIGRWKPYAAHLAPLLGPEAATAGA